MFCWPTANLRVPVVVGDQGLLVNLTPSPSLHINLRRCELLLQKVCWLYLQHVTGDGYFWRRSKWIFQTIWSVMLFGSNGEWKHIITDLPCCPSLGSIMPPVSVWGAQHYFYPCILLWLRVCDHHRYLHSVRGVWASVCTQDYTKFMSCPVV